MRPVRWQRRRLARHLVCAGVFMPIAAAARPTEPFLPASLAVAAAQAAMHACRSHGLRVAVAVVDHAGSLRVLIADDRVKEIDIESARRKAHTAAALDVATGDVAAAVNHAPGYARLLAALDDRLIFVGGGVPIHAGPDLIGAIAVGGAPGGDQDAACARAGIEAIGARLN